MFPKLSRPTASVSGSRGSRASHLQTRTYDTIFLADIARNVAGTGDGEEGPWESTRDQKIKSTDRAINKLVYELYGLTDEEIKIVEGS